MAAAQIRLPFEPLSRYLQHRHDIADEDWKTSVICHVTDVSRRRVETWRAGGIPVDSADDIAIRCAGVHPCLIWGEDWWRLPIPDDEYGPVVIPAPPPIHTMDTRPPTGAVSRRRSRKGVPLNLSAEQLSERARKAWATRRQRQAVA